jgi:hypothetical protein
VVLQVEESFEMLPNFGIFDNTFFSLPIEVLFPKLTINVTGEREREQAHLENAVQQRVVCCVREG